MFGIFKKKPKEKPLPQLLDIDGNQLAEGDTVECLRYDMGESKITLEGRQFFYESVKTGKKISYVKMIDAVTENQKVKKIGG